MSGAETLRGKETLCGFWSVSGDVAILDAAASTTPDFVVIDTQHGVDLSALQTSHFSLLAGYGVPALVRVESLNPGRIGRALDLGASGIVVPLVETADDARQALLATRHAPSGVRSYGMQTRRAGPFDEAPFVVIQVETAAAVDNLDAIAAIDGVDALYVGPADLGLALGGVAAPNVNRIFDGGYENAPVLRTALRAVVEASESHGVVPGLHAHDGAAAARAFSEGFRMSAVTSDVGLVVSGLGRELRAAREG